MRQTLLRCLQQTKGQSFLEYALIAAIVGAAIVAMSTYAFRAVQSTQQAIQQESTFE